jgi:TorA maturation chaperone TorD
MRTARPRAYALLSRLLLDPVEERTAERLHEVAVLSEALGDAPDLDELAAEHHTLLSMEVPPYQGAFLDPEGLVGGEHATRLFELYEASGFTAHRSDVTDDHLGVILGALSFLTGAAEDARADGAHVRAEDIDGRIRHLLDHHLLRWLPSFHAAATRHASGFWRIAVDLTTALVADHRAQLGELPDAVEPLPPTRRLLDEESTSLRGIARYLTTPVQAGTVFTRSDIAALGHAVDIPRGFGPRINMLESLFRGSAEYDQFPAAVDAVASEIQSHDAALGELAGAYPALRPFIATWRERIAATRALLDDMRARAGRIAAA